MTRTLPSGGRERYRVHMYQKIEHGVSGHHVDPGSLGNVVPRIEGELKQKLLELRG